MNYSAGLASIAAFSAARPLPHAGAWWVAARLMLDGAGALFGIYLLAAVVLAVVGAHWRARDARRS